MKKWMAVLAALWVWLVAMGGAAEARMSAAPVQDTAVFIQLDPFGVADLKETEKLIGDEVSQKLNAAGHKVVPLEDSQRLLRIYSRENANTATQRGSDDILILKGKDFTSLGHTVGARHVVLISSRITNAEVKTGFWEERKNLTILTDIIVYDVQNGKYIMAETFSNVGKTGGSYDRAYQRAVKDMLEDVTFSY